MVDDDIDTAAKAREQLYAESRTAESATALASRDLAEAYRTLNA